MSYDPKTKLHSCDLCEQPRDSGADLTEVRKPGNPSRTLRICASKRCWDEVAEWGYPTGGNTSSATSG